MCAASKQANTVLVCRLPKRRSRTHLHCRLLCCPRCASTCYRLWFGMPCICRPYQQAEIDMCSRAARQMRSRTMNIVHVCLPRATLATHGKLKVGNLPHKPLATVQDPCAAPAANQPAAPLAALQAVVELDGAMRDAPLPPVSQACSRRERPMAVPGGEVRLVLACHAFSACTLAPVKYLLNPSVFLHCTDYQTQELTPQ